MGAHPVTCQHFGKFHAPPTGISPDNRRFPPDISMCSPTRIAPLSPWHRPCSYSPTWNQVRRPRLRNHWATRSRPMWSNGRASCSRRAKPVGMAGGSPGAVTFWTFSRKDWTKNWLRGTSPSPMRSPAHYASWTKSNNPTGSMCDDSGPSPCTGDARSQEFAPSSSTATIK